MIIVVESGCDDQVGAFQQPIKGPICKLSPWIQSSKGLILHRLSVYQHNCTALSPTLSYCFIHSESEWSGGCWDFRNECHCNAVRAQAKYIYWHIDSNKHGGQTVTPPTKTHMHTQSNAHTHKENPKFSYHSCSYTYKDVTCIKSLWYNLWTIFTPYVFWWHPSLFLHVQSRTESW